MSREYFARTPLAGHLVTSAASQLVTVNGLGDDKWPVIYLKNLDAGDAIVVKIGANSSVVASNASATGQYDDQFVLIAEEEIRVALHDIRFMAVIRANGVVGTPALRWRTGLD